METPPPGEPAGTFVIRLWIEWTDGAPFWRGSIRHLQTSDQVAFEDLDAACEFIRTCLAPRPGRPRLLDSQCRTAGGRAGG
jgi:hypothetical protein